ncbi:hypothetical protein LIA77_04769 [Sarocladium implicatum]|nr:hypothetical protein LIA77_04769 [Sarocladium implicatum]
MGLGNEVSLGCGWGGAGGGGGLLTSGGAVCLLFAGRGRGPSFSCCDLIGRSHDLKAGSVTAYEMAHGRKWNRDFNRFEGRCCSAPCTGLSRAPGGPRMRYCQTVAYPKPASHFNAASYDPGTYVECYAVSASLFVKKN